MSMSQRPLRDRATRDRTGDLLLAKSAQVRVAMGRLRHESNEAGDLAPSVGAGRSYGAGGGSGPLPSQYAHASPLMTLPTRARRRLESASRRARPASGGRRPEPERL